MKVQSHGNLYFIRFMNLQFSNNKNSNSNIYNCKLKQQEKTRGKLCSCGNAFKHKLALGINANFPEERNILNVKQLNSKFRIQNLSTSRFFVPTKHSTQFTPQHPKDVLLMLARHFIGRHEPDSSVFSFIKVLIKLFTFSTIFTTNSAFSSLRTRNSSTHAHFLPRTIFNPVFGVFLVCCLI